MKLPKGIVSENKYGKYYVPLFCGPKCKVASKIKSGKVWENETINFMIDNLGNGDVIHAGTYFGDFLPALSKNIKERFYVWAFEPNPLSYMCAKKTIEINQLDNIHIQNVGLGSKEDSMYVKIERDNGKSLGGGAKIIKEHNEYPVQVCRLDILIPKERNVSILHLDVEGYEKQCLQGAFNLIKRNYPILILEVGKKRNMVDSIWFKESILSLGYKEKKKINENLVYTI